MSQSVDIKGVRGAAEAATKSLGTFIDALVAEPPKKAATKTKARPKARKPSRKKAA